jgi:hypothetical protein
MEANVVRQRFLLLLPAFILPPVPGPISGQEIRIQVLTLESREPIPTAFLTLMDGESRPLRHALTDGDGRASLPLPRSGLYRVRAEAFGRATSLSPWIHLQGDSLGTHRFHLSIEAIPIAGIRAESDPRCRINPRDGREIARVWEEVQKALSIQTWTNEAGRYRTRIVAWERELDPEGRAVSSDITREFYTTARNPILSLPVDSLLNYGFIQRGKNRTEYFGPDASILLSDPFLDSHCFQLAEAVDHPKMIGLRFQPTREEPPDVEGTFWVDRETAYLRSLDFKYVNAPTDLTEGVAGGRVDFERLPDGTWIVKRWWIRIPIRRATWIFGRKHLVGMHERGAVVSEITPASRVRGTQG